MRKLLLVYSSLSYISPPNQNMTCAELNESMRHGASRMLQTSLCNAHLECAQEQACHTMNSRDPVLCESV